MSFCCSLKVVVFVVWLYSDVLLYGSSDDHVVAAVVTDNGAATRVKLLSSCCSSQLLLSRTLFDFQLFSSLVLVTSFRAHVAWAYVPGMCFSTGCQCKGPSVH